jgi:IS605 OrfB family transposase
LLRKRSRRERRFARDVNHCISKAICSTAQGTQRGIALEVLQGIRNRAGQTVRKRQRRVLHSWEFFQLRSFIAYKAQMAGVRVVLVNPAYTSQTCSHCGHREKANRKSQSKFLCVACGYAANADLNAAVNISRVAVIPPNVATLAG